MKLDMFPEDVIEAITFVIRWNQTGLCTLKYEKACTAYPKQAF